jgi:hypothetical protein
LNTGRAFAEYLEKHYFIHIHNQTYKSCLFLNTAFIEAPGGAPGHPNQTDKGQPQPSWLLIGKGAADSPFHARNAGRFMNVSMSVKSAWIL